MPQSVDASDNDRGRLARISYRCFLLRCANNAHDHRVLRPEQGTMSDVVLYVIVCHENDTLIVHQALSSTGSHIRNHRLLSPLSSPLSVVASNVPYRTNNP